MTQEAVAFTLESPDFPALRRLWTDLEARADITFFLSWSWIGAWIEEAGPPDHVLVGRAGGEVVCLGLLRKSVQRRHFFVRSRTLALHETGDVTRDIVVIEYNKFLADRRFDGLTPRAIAYLRQNNAVLGRFDELQIGGMAEADHAAVQASHGRTNVTSRKTTAFVDLQAIRESGGDYLATISSNARYQIRRAIKIYESRGKLSLRKAQSVEEALHFYEALGVLHEGAWEKRGMGGGAWRYPFLVNFHRRVIENTFAQGGVEIVRIDCGAVPIGYIHCLVHDGWYGSYLSGLAYEEDNKVKPGLVSHYLYIEHLLKGGGQTYDFLAGDHRYKASLGQPGEDMVWFTVQERRPQLIVEEALRTLKRKIERLVRRTG